MLRDIDFAFFTQLSYLNWNNLDIEKIKKNELYKKITFMNFLTNPDIWNKIKTEWYDSFSSISNSNNKNLIFHEDDKRIFGLFSASSESSCINNLKPTFNFDKWSFIYSANKTKLYKDLYDLDFNDDGFFAAAFLCEEDIIIAYRGTEPDSLNDLLTDLEIGGFNKNSSQLTTAYLFLEYIKRMFPHKSIHITGHSLGGCLAQYAYICSGKIFNTKTWNALGFRKNSDILNTSFLFGNDLSKYLKFPSIEILSSLKTMLLTTTGEISDDFITMSEKNLIDIISNRIYSFSIKSIQSNEEVNLYEKEKFGIKFKFGVYSKNSEHDFRFNDNIKSEIKNESLKSAIQIYWLLKSLKNYQLNSEKLSVNIINFYNSLDWTASLQVREGKVLDVLTNSQNLLEGDNSNKLLTTLKKVGFNYHGVNSFLFYMNESGNIEGGKFNSFFSKYFLKDNFSFLECCNIDINSLLLKTLKK